MKKIRTIFPNILLMALAGTLLLGCNTIKVTMGGVNPLTGTLVLLVGIVAIVTIIIYIARMGTRHGDEQREA